MSIEQIRTELLEIEKACMALRATGGTRFRKHFKASDRELQHYAAAVPGALKLTMLRMLAGQILAERIGKAAELDVLTEEMIKTMLQGSPFKTPPKGKEPEAAEPPELPARGTGRGNDHGI